MNSSWKREFQRRIESYIAKCSSKDNGIVISIKIRVTGGCFHREHSPRAYEIIDNFLESCSEETRVSFQEHESGPELLVILALGTAGITLAKSVIDLITTIFKARADGIKKGDYPAAPLELIVRRYDQKDRVFEEKVLKIDVKDPISRKLIEESLQVSIEKLIPSDIKEHDAE
jgi:hypothetical protein